MNNSQLQKVLRLIKKTHDRVVVLDQASDDVVVLLRLEDYEGIALDPNKTEEPKINPPTELAALENLGENDEDQEEVPPIIKNFANSSPKLDFSSDWPASNASRSDAGWTENNAVHSEPLDNLPEDEVEEKFYPEPVE